MDRHFLFQQRTRTGPDRVDHIDWVVTHRQSREAVAAGDDCATVEWASIAEAVEYMQDHLGLPKRNDGESSLSVPRRGCIFVLPLALLLSVDRNQDCRPQ